MPFRVFTRQSSIASSPRILRLPRLPMSKSKSCRCDKSLGAVAHTSSSALLQMSIYAMSAVKQGKQGREHHTHEQEQATQAAFSGAHRAIHIGQTASA